MYNSVNIYLYVCACVHPCMCVYVCVHVHAHVCDDNYMYKEEWVAGPNTSWRISHKPSLMVKMQSSVLYLYLYGRCINK